MTAADLVIDIETIPVPLEKFSPAQIEYLSTREELGEALVERRSLYGWTCEICAIAMMNAESGRGQILYRSTATGQIDKDVTFPDGWDEQPFDLRDEARMLEEAWKMIRAFSRLVTYNGRGFDLPVLAQRSLILGVKVPINPSTYRYSFRDHCDLLEAVTCFGSTRKFPLGFICETLGIATSKSTMCGSDVEDRWRQGRYAEIAAYCAGDVVATAKLYARVSEIMGVMLAK